MQTLKIKFDQLYPGFNPESNVYTRILSKRFKVVVSDNPDFYFFTHSYYGKENYLNYKCHRVFYGGENVRANWNICDYVIDSDFYENNPRHLRFPLWALWKPSRLTGPKNEANFLSKKKFCCMVVSNAKAKERIAFFHQLSKYKKVDSGGRFLNNIGIPIENKIEFIKDYKFVISFENSSYPGYTTEKIIEPMLVDSIPIYWGNPFIAKDFNIKSFINIENANQFDTVIEQIIEIDNDDEKFLSMVREPWFINNVVPKEVDEEALIDFFKFIIEDSKIKKPVAKSFSKRNIHKMDLFKTKALFKINRSLKKLNFHNFL
ncbi:MAG: glycosyltransferase family 10 domain-containing protein [Ginsengibacter sp.]